MEKANKKYFNNLDGLRFLLAFVVFGSHSMLGVSLNQIIPIDFFNRLITVLTSGYLGVSFFFVLSGFLITYLMLEERELNGVFKVSNFYCRRILRIWPLYFSVLIFTFGIYPIIKSYLGYHDQNPFNLLLQLFFLANFDSIHVHQQNLVDVAPMMININWSVSIEEQFYLIWPLLFVAVKGRQFWMVCLITIVVSWVFRVVASDDAIIYYHTLSVISDMAIGGLGAYLCFYKKNFLTFIRELSKPSIIIIYISGMAFLMYAELSFNEYFNYSSARIINSLFFCFIIIEQSFAEKSWFKFSRSQRLSSMGKYTYGLYMLHPIGVQTAIIAFRYAGLQREENIYFSILYVVISFLVAIGLSVLSYHGLEKYFLDKRKLFY